MHTQAQMGSGVTLETTRPRTQRQEELVQAASRLFAERGYYNVGINDISAELGLSGPALYHHYPSKEALLVDVMNTVATSQVDGMREVATSSPDPTIRLTGMIKYHVGFAFDQREYLAAWRTEFHNLPVPERRRLRQIQRLYVNEWMRAVGAIQQTADSEQLLAICHAALALMQAPTAAQNVLQRPEHEQLLCEMAYTVLTAKLPVTREHAGSRVRRT
jgi:AcrR family transcriptional regulator